VPGPDKPTIDGRDIHLRSIEIHMSESVREWRDSYPREATDTLIVEIESEIETQSA
jgi:hypothetical protein